jgi:hypothetical protein
MNHSIDTYEDHLRTVLLSLRNEAKFMDSVRSSTKKPVDGVLGELSNDVQQARARGVEYAKLDVQFKSLLETRVEPLILWLNRLHERSQNAIKRIESASKELRADFAGVRTILPDSLKQLFDRAKADCDLIGKDERFIERSEQAMMKRMDQLIDSMITRDIARAQRHHHPSDTPLATDLERLDEISRKIEKYAALIAERARRAKVHLDDTCELIEQEIQGVVKLKQLSTRTDPFELDRAA